jgi:ribosomal protein S18 acetylase RimI-like enzyme
VKDLNIETAKPADAVWLNEKITREFPYTKFTPDKIEEKIKDPRFLVLIAKQENIYTGFSEIELFIDKKEARLNGIYVEDAWRDQGIAKAMIARMIEYCKTDGIEKLFLLVKKTNTDAKELYKRTKFTFEKMHEKEIEGTQVEVWSQIVPKDNPHRHHLIK